MKQVNEIEDETMSDAFFTKILQYKSLLVDRQFVEKVMAEIERFQSIRRIIISLCSLLGFISLMSVLSLDWMRDFELAATSIFEPLAKLPTESIAVIVMSSIAMLGFWLVVDD